MSSAETQLASHFAKYEPAMAGLGKALRAKLRAQRARKAARSASARRKARARR